ncbi:hypothetical protein ANO11243_095300 [Dothideomycetidae sp. 11243]|nr:hypothetical protein ANO11243_095300 [fungal sp. No.11243]
MEEEKKSGRQVQKEGYQKKKHNPAERAAAERRTGGPPPQSAIRSPQSNRNAIAHRLTRTLLCCALHTALSPPILTTRSPVRVSMILRLANALWSALGRAWPRVLHAANLAVLHHHYDDHRRRRNSREVHAPSTLPSASPSAYPPLAAPSAAATHLPGDLMLSCTPHAVHRTLHAAPSPLVAVVAAAAASTPAVRPGSTYTHRCPFAGCSVMQNTSGPH